MKNICIVSVIVFGACAPFTAIARKNRDSTSEELRPIESVAPRSPAAVEETIVRLVEEGHIQEAQAEAKRSGFTDDRLTRVTGILLFAVGDSGHALDYLKRAHQDAPSDPRIALYLAEVLCAKKDFASARSLVEGVSSKALAGQQRPWEPTFRKAQVLSWLRDFNGAKVLYASIPEMPGVSPKFVTDARVGLAELASWQKDFDGATRLLKPVLASSPDHVEATLIKGQILEWQEKYKEAKGLYNAGLQAHPNDAQLRWRLEKLSWVK